MRIAMMIFIFLIASIPADSFSQGTIHLFADTTSLDISADIAQFGIMKIWIAYSDLNNAELPCITGLEFMIDWNDPYLVEAGPPVFREEIVSITGGD